MLASAGQANHAAVNAFMDALAHRRHGSGLPALTINWGPWRDIGAAERSGTAERLRARGVGSIAPEDGMAILEHLMSTGEVQVAAIPLSADAEDGSRVDRLFARYSVPRVGSISRASEAVREAASPSIDWRRRVADAGDDRRTEMVLECVRAQVGGVLRATSDLDPLQLLSDLGLDSLMAVELKNRLESALGVTIPLAKILAGQHCEGLVIECVIRLEEPPRAGSAADGGVNAGMPGAGVDQLSDDAVDALLGEMLVQGERDE
jgi:acyl carrier protein